MLGPANSREPVLHPIGEQPPAVQQSHPRLALPRLPHVFCSVATHPPHIYKVGQEQRYPPPGPATGRNMSMRVVNQENVASFYIRSGSEPWRMVVSYKVAGYNHNMADGFMSFRPAIFATGMGRARFSQLAYKAMNKR